jgi:hypothetical protein
MIELQNHNTYFVPRLDILTYSTMDALLKRSSSIQKIYKCRQDFIRIKYINHIFLFLDNSLIIKFNLWKIIFLYSSFIKFKIKHCTEQMTQDIYNTILLETDMLNIPDFNNAEYLNNKEKLSEFLTNSKIYNINHSSYKIKYLKYKYKYLKLSKKI